GVFHIGSLGQVQNGNVNKRSHGSIKEGYVTMIRGTNVILVSAVGALFFCRILFSMAFSNPDHGPTKTEMRLIRQLKQGNASERMDAARELGEKQTGRAGRFLMKALHDRNQYVRGWVAWALGQIGDASAVGPIINAFVKYDIVSKTDYTCQQSKCLTSF